MMFRRWWRWIDLLRVDSGIIVCRRSITITAIAFTKRCRDKALLRADVATICRRHRFIESFLSIVRLSCVDSLVVRRQRELIITVVLSGCLASLNITVCGERRILLRLIIIEEHGGQKALDGSAWILGGGRMMRI